MENNQNSRFGDGGQKNPFGLQQRRQGLVHRDGYPELNPSRVSGPADDEYDGGEAEERNVPSSDPLENGVTDTGTIDLPEGERHIHCLTVIGQVEGHYVLPSDNKSTKYEHIIPRLIAVEQSKEIAGLLIVLNTVGGDVEAGLAIAELIAGMKKPTVSLILGGGHSIGAPLAVAAKCSFIAPSASITIHPVRMNGPLIGVSQTMHYFDRMQDRITRFICDNSNMTEARYRKLLANTKQLTSDIGTVLDGNEAVSEGLIDRLGGLSDALDELKRQILGQV